MDPDEPEELAERMAYFYRGCSLFPEDNPKAFIALIELRALAPRAIEFLWELAAYRRLQNPWLKVDTDGPLEDLSDD